MIKPVTIFLKPKPENPSEAEIVAHPDVVKLFIDVEIADDGMETVTNADEVIWVYSQTPPPELNLPSFQGAPAAADINVEVRFAPNNSPFGSNPSGGAAPASLSPELEVLPEPDEQTYVNIGINPIVPNKPREDAAPAPTEPLGIASEAEPVEGPEQDYEYAIVLTSRTTVNALDPKVIVVRRHRRRSTI